MSKSKERDEKPLNNTYNLKTSSVALYKGNNSNLIGSYSKLRKKAIKNKKTHVKNKYSEKFVRLLTINPFLNIFDFSKLKRHWRSQVSLKD